jgi:co-chaperonin GroES (HSP10)
MSPFEALYGRPCRTPLSWSESGERVIFGPDIVIEVEEKVKQIQANILAAQSRQKSYTDKRRRPMEFEVGDNVYLEVSPMKGVRRFGIKGKLVPVISVCILSSTSMGQRLMKWSYHQNY